MNKTCSSCNACKITYRLSACSYFRARSHPLYCALRGELTERDSVCGHWEKKQAAEYDLSPQRFDGAKEDIRALEKFFKEV